MKTRVRFAAIVAVLALLIGFVAERYLAYGLSFDALLTLRHASRRSPPAGDAASSW